MKLNEQGYCTLFFKLCGAKQTGEKEVVRVQVIVVIITDAHFPLARTPSINHYRQRYC